MEFSWRAPYGSFLSEPVKLSSRGLWSSKWLMCGEGFGREGEAGDVLVDGYWSIAVV